MKRNRVYKANISEWILDQNTFQVSDQPLPQLLRVSFLIYEQRFWPTSSTAGVGLLSHVQVRFFDLSVQLMLFGEVFFSVWFDFSLLSYFLFSATIDEGENETNDSSDDVDAIKSKTNKVKQLRLDVENLRKFISDQYAEDIGNNCRMQWVSEPVNLALPTKLTHAPS